MLVDMHGVELRVGDPVYHSDEVHESFGVITEVKDSVFSVRWEEGGTIEYVLSFAQYLAFNGTLTIPYVRLKWESNNTATHIGYFAQVESKFGRYHWAVSDLIDFGVAGAGWGRSLEDAKFRAERFLSFQVALNEVGIDNIRDL